MNLLLICHEYPPVGGGAATVAASLARTLGKEHAVTVLTSRCRGVKAREENDGVKVVQAWTARRAVYGASPIEMIVFTMSAIVAGLRVCRRERFDGCLAIQGIPAAWVALPLATLFRFPYLVALVGADVPGFLPERYDRLHRLVGWATRRTWRGASAVVANSESLRLLAERTSRPIGVTVESVYFGVDADSHQPAPPTAKPPVPLLLFVGRLSAQKGARYLIDAVAIAQGALRGKATIVIVGDGDEHEQLVAQATAAGVADLVVFRGWVSREELATWYRRASVFVLPSLDEGRSQALLEAMACGLAVVATSIDSNAGLVVDGVSGVVVAPRDAAGLAAALVRLVEQGPERIAAMGRAGRSIALQFSWQRAAERCVSYLMREALSASRR